MKVHLTHVKQKSEEKSLKSEILALGKRINRQWEMLAPTQQEELIDILQSETDSLRFQYVFPITRDLPAFTNKVHNIAAKVLKTNSTAPFKTLSEAQQREVTK